MKNCSNCGGNLVFSPKDKGNKCQSCASVFFVPYKYRFEKKPFVENVFKDEDDFATTVSRIRCKSCGANVLLDKFEVQTACPYCGNSQIVKSNRKRLLHIDSIIPFAIDKKKACSSLKSQVRKRFYAHKTIFKNVTEKDFVGTFINAFVFDIVTSSTYTGVFTYEYSSNSSEGSSTETRKKEVSGIFDKTFTNLTIESNTNLNQDELLSVMPFQYASAVEFNSNFMNGYMLEYKDKIFEDCFKVAEKVIKNRIANELLKKHNCDAIEELTLNVGYIDKKYNYCLLPVYFVNADYKDKKYRAIINGQTGKVGNLPTNKWRIFLTILLSCGLIVAFIFLIFHLV